MYLIRQNDNITLCVCFYYNRFNISFDVFYCQWFYSMLSDITHVLLLAGHKRWFSLISENAVRADSYTVIIRCHTLISEWVLIWPLRLSSQHSFYTWNLVVICTRLTKEKYQWFLSMIMQTTLLKVLWSVLASYIEPFEMVCNGTEDSAWQIYRGQYHVKCYKCNKNWLIHVGIYKTLYIRIWQKTYWSDLLKFDQVSIMNRSTCRQTNEFHIHCIVPMQYKPLQYNIVFDRDLDCGPMYWKIDQMLLLLYFIVPKFNIRWSTVLIWNSIWLNVAMVRNKGKVT